MEKGKTVKIIIILYIIAVLFAAYNPLLSVFTKTPSIKSGFETLDIGLLDSSIESLGKRNYIYNININSIDLGNFTFGNADPFQ